MDIIIYLAIAVVALAVGALATVGVQKAMARSRAKAIIDEANREAEVIRQKELLKGREESRTRLSARPTSACRKSSRPSRR